MEGFFEKMMYFSKGKKELRQWAGWIPGERAALERYTLCKGPMAGGYLLCSKGSKENTVAGAENMEERLGEVIRTAVLRIFVC